MRSTLLSIYTFMSQFKYQLNIFKTACAIFYLFIIIIIIFYFYFFLTKTNSSNVVPDVFVSGERLQVVSEKYLGDLIHADFILRLR